MSTNLTDLLAEGRCPRCGHGVQENWSFCPWCGQGLPYGEEPEVVSSLILGDAQVDAKITRGRRALTL